MSLKSDPGIVSSDGALSKESHGRYFFEFVTFEVEKVLFRVPKNDFIQSNPKFFDRFDIPGGPSDEDGLRPIELKGVTVQAFEGLLLVLHPHAGTATTYDEWLGALELATLWDFPQVRARAIARLSVLNRIGSRKTIEILQLAKKYRIDTWFREGCMKLAQQKNLDLDDLVNSLGYETTLRIYAAKVQHYERVQPVSMPRCIKCGEGQGRACCKISQAVTPVRLAMVIIVLFAARIMTA